CQRLKLRVKASLSFWPMASPRVRRFFTFICISSRDLQAMSLDSGSAQIMRTCLRDPNWTRLRLKSDDNWNLETFINFTVFKPNHLSVKEDVLCHLYKF